jgi:opacity protein-like surface antigen
MKKTLFLLVLLFHILFSGSAQGVKFEAGQVLSTFKFINSQGREVTGLKPGAGSMVGLSLHWDEVKKDSTHHGAISFARRLNYDLGVRLLAYNAVGDIGQSAFSYQSTFACLQTKVGYRIPVAFGASFNIQAIGSVNQILQGNQLVQNSYADLTQDSQFNNLKFMAGAGVCLEKNFNNKLIASVGYQYQNTLNTKVSSGASINIQTNILAIGLRWNVN